MGDFVELLLLFCRLYTTIFIILIILSIVFYNYIIFILFVEYNLQDLYELKYNYLLKVKELCKNDKKKILFKTDRKINR